MKRVIVDGKTMYEPTDEERASVLGALQGVKSALEGCRAMADEELAEWKASATPGQRVAQESLSDALQNIRSRLTPDPEQEETS